MREEYPRPQFKRDSFINLNKIWDFDFDDEHLGHKEKWFKAHEFGQKIQVPFAFQSKLSGIGDTSFHNHVWYHTTFKNTNEDPNIVTIINFLGVDYYTEVYVNGFKVKEHTGMNGSFNVDITDYINVGDNDITLYVFDPDDRSIPRGKQDWELDSHAIWYTRTTGIYKSVFIEQINQKHIKNFFIKTKIDGYKIDVDLETTSNNGRIMFVVNNKEDELIYEFNVVKNKCVYSFNLPNDFANDRLWRPEWPFLYDLKIKLFDENNTIVDEVSSYFGIREIKTIKDKVYLNNHRLFQLLVLNQGYYPDGILTAPSIETMEQDIQNMKALGFNGCRIHQKVEEPYFLYLCDKLGFLVWQECASCYGYSSNTPKRMLDEWIEIVKDNFNHPSIICYTPLNESWGVEGIAYDKTIQAHAQSLYYLIKSLDDTRLVIGNDGWEQPKTDLITVHNYAHGSDEEKEKYARFKGFISNRKGIMDFEMIGRHILADGFKDEGQPILLTEFGGVSYSKTNIKKSWGYTTSDNEKDYLKDLARIYKAIEDSKCIEGICYTQYTDVEQETNGLLTYDREFKCNPKLIKNLNESLKEKKYGRK